MPSRLEGVEANDQRGGEELLVAKKKPSASATAKPSAKTAVLVELESHVEEVTQEIGRYLFEHLRRRKASIFEKRWWEDRILSWAMGDEAVKVQMFRFVDVLPRLKTHTAVARHLQEYFEEVSTHLPGAAAGARLGRAEHGARPGAGGQRKVECDANGSAVYCRLDRR